MKTFILIAALLISVKMFCQIDYSVYSNVKAENKKLLFIDNFDNNKNEWYLGIKEDVWRESIDSGYFYFEALEDKAKEDYIKVPFDSNKDFEIELSMKFNGGDRTKANGFQWGKSVNTNYQYDFLFSGNGQYTIDKFTGKFQDYVPFTESPLVKKDDFNKLTIRKTDGMYYFFLNESLVHKTAFEPFFGDYIGIQVAELSQVLVDYIKINEIQKNTVKQAYVVNITDHDFFSKNGKAEVGQPIHLSLEIKNESHIDINNFDVSFKLPEGTTVISNSLSNISLQAHEKKEGELIFFLTDKSKDSKFSVELDIPKATSTNAKSYKISFEKGESLPSKANEFASSEKLVYRGDPLKGLNMGAVMQEIQVGKYYALIIGIDKYSGAWKKLDNAVSDAKAVESILKDKYQFDNFISLYNEQATRENILSKLEWLMQNVKENDNVFIYYSGHGEYKKELNKGFWVPVDATVESMTKYIANDNIKTFLSGIKSKHTLLVADACFSGDIFRGKTLTIPYDGGDKYYNKVYSMNSRKAIASGGLEPVMDGGKDGHSIFAYYFLRALNNNANKYLDASQLYNTIKIPIVNNSEQTPGFSPIRNTGDEGGQFVFIKK